MSNWQQNNSRGVRYSSGQPQIQEDEDGQLTGAGTGPTPPIKQNRAVPWGQRQNTSARSSTAARQSTVARQGTIARLSTIDRRRQVELGGRTWVERYMDGVRVTFQFGRWEDSAADAAIDLLNQRTDLKWRAKKAMICQPPQEGSAWHKGGREGDARADPENHITVSVYDDVADGTPQITRLHGRENGYGTGVTPNRQTLNRFATQGHQQRRGMGGFGVANCPDLDSAERDPNIGLTAAESIAFRNRTNRDWNAARAATVDREPEGRVNGNARGNVAQGGARGGYVVPALRQANNRVAAYGRHAAQPQNPNMAGSWGGANQARRRPT